MIKDSDLIALVDACLDEHRGLAEIVRQVRIEEPSGVKEGVINTLYALRKVTGQNQAEAKRILDEWEEVHG